MTTKKPIYHSKIWFEEAEADNPFAAKASYCHGYNVTEDILPEASLSQYLYLLFKGHRPSATQQQLLEKTAVSIANPGMRDLSIRAAMNAGVGGSTAASCLIAALGVGAGQYSGAHEIYTLVEQWYNNSTDLTQWQAFYANPNINRTRESIWPAYEHPPGFDPNGDKCPTTIIQTLEYLASIESNGPLTWLMNNRLKLEEITAKPLNITGVIGAAFYQLEMSAKQAEMLYLLLRLPGAAVHALEQESYGWRKFPFFGKDTHLTDDPGDKGLPDVGEFGL